MTSFLTSEAFYTFLVKQLGNVLTTTLHRTYSTPSNDTLAIQEEERELERLQMDRLLKWMELVFDDAFTPSDTLSTETKQQYKQELFSVYRTICSDYAQYRRWKMHNDSLWLFSSYRTHDTKALARKLLSDIRLFKEGLQLFFMMAKGTE